MTWIIEDLIGSSVFHDLWCGEHPDRVMRTMIQIEFKDYDAFLRTSFGDNYMTPIKAPSLHGEVVFDTGRSYLEVLPEVRKEYRRSAWKRLKKKLGIR